MDRDYAVGLPERVYFPCTHAQLTANTTQELCKVPAGRKLRIDAVDYHNVTGLAESASNAFAITLQNGATVVANGIDTDSDEPGADNGIAADTHVAMTVVTAAGANVLAAGDVLSAVFAEDGTATLPPGTFWISGRLL